MAYSTYVIIKQKGQKLPKYTACFSLFNDVYDNIQQRWGVNALNGASIYIQIDENIQDPYKYIEFVNECFGFKTCEYKDLKDSSFEYVTTDIKPKQYTSTGHYLEFYNFDQQFINYDKRTLLLLTFIRYLQEFPEIVTFLETNGYSWDNLIKAHKEWYRLRELDKVKYNNFQHMIVGATDPMVSLETFQKNIKNSTLSSVYQYTS